MQRWMVMRNHSMGTDSVIMRETFLRSSSRCLSASTASFSNTFSCNTICSTSGSQVKEPENFRPKRLPCSIK